jgi:hypothetical protein
MKLKIGEKTLTPKQAIIFSVVGFLFFVILGLGAYLYFEIVTVELLLISSIGSFYSLVFPWACLHLETRNKCIKAHNRFIYFAVGIIIAVLIVQWGTENLPFPMWAIIAVIIGAVAAYSVMVYYAIVNFIRWIKENDED